MAEMDKGKISSQQVDEATVSAYLSTQNAPDPDLLVRTSGEFRISNFLLWQLAYTEIYISQCFWPDFRRGELYRAIKDFQKRERRFGMVSEQVRHKEDGQVRLEGSGQVAKSARENALQRALKSISGI